VPTLIRQSTVTTRKQHMCQEAMKRYDFTDYDGVFQEGCCVEDGEDRELWEAVLNEVKEVEQCQ